MPRDLKWWQDSATIYQVYPASFKDSKGTGTGDLVGIISKLDYIRSLGISTVWVSPFFMSPQFDNGYDISDYRKVDPKYGNLHDAEALIKGCHERGMKCLFDLVINHSSSEHEWFKEARSSKENKYRKYYHWREARIVDGVRREPNNWRGCFGGSVWEWDEGSQEYYLHYFAKEQPDFNWEIPEVRKAIYDEAITFWLEKGLDGFRVDVANMYSKFTDFPDAKVTDTTQVWQPARDFMTNGPHLHEYLKEMMKETFEKYDALSIGEMPNTPDLKTLLSYISSDAHQLSMVIQFDLANVDQDGRFPLVAKDWKMSDFKSITAWSQRLAEPQNKAWPLTVLENHDLARCVSRFGDASNRDMRERSAKMLATYQLTMSGTPIIYQGQEIGMINIPPEWPMSEYKDVNTINSITELASAAHTNPTLLARGEDGIRRIARDHARTPMQWDSSPQAGFSTSGETWMKVMDSYVDINVAEQEGREGSPLEFLKFLIKLRKEYKDVLVEGEFVLLDEENAATLSYLKKGEERSVFVALNFEKGDQEIYDGVEVGGKKLVFSSTGKKEDELEEKLEAFEARVYVLQK